LDDAKALIVVDDVDIITEIAKKENAIAAVGDDKDVPRWKRNTEEAVALIPDRMRSTICRLLQI
jgi:hypothetical protein